MTPCQGNLLVHHPIYYVNAPFISAHLGTAYTTIAADAIDALPTRMNGATAASAFVTGMDEHGQRWPTPPPLDKGMTHLGLVHSSAGARSATHGTCWASPTSMRTTSEPAPHHACSAGKFRPLIAAGRYLGGQLRLVLRAWGNLLH